MLITCPLLTLRPWGARTVAEGALQSPVLGSNPSFPGFVTLDARFSPLNTSCLWGSWEEDLVADV